MWSRWSVLAILLLAAPAAAQDTHSLTYGAGANPAGDRGLHIAASLEPRPARGQLSRQFSVVLHDGDERDLFVLTNLLYRARGAYRRTGATPYALAGLGLFTGHDLPLAANAAVGVESTFLSTAPVYLEARLLYAAGVYYNRGSSLGIGEHHLLPGLTLGVRLPLRP